jgi:hypothetical protein
MEEFSVAFLAQGDIENRLGLFCFLHARERASELYSNYVCQLS